MDEAGTEQSAIIDIAGYDVPVLANGLYDRYRSNPPLSVIEQESPLTDLSWFKTVFINLLKPTQGLNEPIPTAQGARKAR
ncbi:hypothetical protein [Oleiphilus messinensis]|uniref:hypothetical protein n=1 Tax=Oleiphilus messinensis TaxID=141451 RepID=UPI000B3B2D7A|nr:hypothetical protein [Oleiphilus messinensis]